MASALELEVVLSLKETLTGALKDINDALEGTKKKTEETFGEKMSKSLRSAAIEATRIKYAVDTIAKPMGDFFKSSIDESMKFESSFAGIRKTVEATEEEFAQLNENIRGLSLEIPIDANELARVGEIAGQLGISGVDNLTKFIETTSLMDVTTNITADDAAVAFARIANVMNEPIENVDRMGSTVVHLGNNFATSEQEIVNFARRIAGAGHVAGLATKDIFAIGTAATSVGIEAEAGGTAVQKVLLQMNNAARGATTSIIDNSKAISDNEKKLWDLKTKLQVATQKQSEFNDKTKEWQKTKTSAEIEQYTREIAALEGELTVLNETNGQVQMSTSKFASVLGMTSAEYQNLFRENPAEAFSLFVQKLGEAGQDAYDILDELGLKDQRLVRAFLSMGGASDQMVAALGMADEAWKNNTALVDEANKRFGTLESKMEVAKNAMDEVKRSIGDVLAPALSGLLDFLTPVIKGFGDFADEHPTITAALGAIATGFVAMSVALGIFAAVALAASVITGVLGATMLPIIAIIGAVVAAVAFLAWAWETNFAHIQEQWGIFVDRFKTRLTEWANYLSDIWNGEWDKIPQHAQEAYDQLLELDKRSQQLHELNRVEYNNKIKLNQAETNEFIVNDTQNALKMFEERTGTSLVKVGDDWRVYQELTKGQSHQVSDTLSNLNFVYDKHMASSQTTLATSGNNFVTYTGQVLAASNNLTQGVATDAQNQTQQIASNAQKQTTVLAQETEKTKNITIKNYKELYGKISEGPDSLVPQMTTQIIQQFESVPGLSNEALKDTGTEVEKQFQNAWTMTNNELGQWPDRLYGWGEKSADAYANGFGTLGDKLQAKVNDAINQISPQIEGHSPPKEGKLHQIDKWGFNIGKSWAEGIVAGMKLLQLPDFAPTLQNSQVYQMNTPAYTTDTTPITNNRSATVNIQNLEVASDLDVQDVASYLGAAVATAVY